MLHNRKKTIAVDFDGTLTVSSAWPKIGAPNWPVINRAIQEKQNGAALILWTCREGKLLDEAISACSSWGLTFDAVNDSTEEWKKFFGNSPRKVGADEYWDDRSVDIRQLSTAGSVPLVPDTDKEDSRYTQPVYSIF